jgi:signal transduction histidine kinase
LRRWIDFICDAPVEVANNHVATNLFRIAQEATHNALRHAEARRVRIELARDAAGRILLIVSDDGRGIDTDSDDREGIGLQSMRHRAELIGADLTVESASGGGTHVCCML